MTAVQVPSSKTKAKKARVTTHTVSKEDKTSKQGTPIISSEQINTIVQEVTNRVLSTLTGTNDTANMQVDQTTPADNATGTLTRDITGGTFRPDGFFTPDASGIGTLPSSNHGETSLLTTSTRVVSQIDQSPIHTQGVPLGAAISQNVKGKILADEFINLGQLISPQVDDYSVAIVHDALHVTQSQKSKGIFSIDQWSQAFTIYSAIYIEKFPEQAQALLRYAFLIRDMAKSYRGYAWRTYDEAFRQARPVTKWPWDQLCHELFMRAVSTSIFNWNTGQGSSGYHNLRGFGSYGHTNRFYQMQNPSNQLTTPNSNQHFGYQHRLEYYRPRGRFLNYRSPNYGGQPQPRQQQPR